LRIFISFHSPDAKFALALQDALKDALSDADVFVDRTNLCYGRLWQPALFEAIAKADKFLILVSHQLGDWQKFEYYEALSRKVRDDRFVLLPVIIADRTKGPAANLPGLGQLHWIESTEPTAPDTLAKIVAALKLGAVPEPPKPWRLVNPYRGLVALEEQDADYFFGREEETAAVLARMIAASGRLIVLIGNSGVGKSSLVLAGIIGALKSQRRSNGIPWPPALKDSRAWAYLAIKPGEDPIEALMSDVAALWYPDATDPKRVERRVEWVRLLREGKARFADLIRTTDERLRDELSLTPPPRIFLYIDQGEELYARSSAADRKRFSDLIADGLAKNSDRLIVMTSQRSDYYGALQANAAWFNLAERIDVPPLNDAKLELVLREPARVLGAEFESPDLVRHMVESAEDQPGALPLLADLMTDLWERMRVRGDGMLRVSDHREIVQIGAALARRADQFLAKAPKKAQAVKRLFTLRLAHVPRHGEPVRARWEPDETRKAGEAGEEVEAEWSLVEELAGPLWRLLVTGEKDGKPTAEVAHEILLKAWPTLKRWLEDERDFLIWRGELYDRLEEYEQAGKPEASTGGQVMPAGLPLDAAGKWLDARRQARRQRQALLMGLPLDTAKKWLALRRQDIKPAGRAYIEASIEAERVAARNRQRLQLAAGLLMLGTIAGLVAFIFKTDIDRLWFEQITLPRYIAANVTEHVLTPEAERARKPGDSPFQECAKCPEMIVIPPGEFLMGSPDGVGDDNEHPLHKVTIAKALAVAKFTVTWDEWDECVRMRGCTRNDRSDYGKGLQPVINVSWDDAKAYVAWLSRITRKSYRLLSEAEWEYAARGVTSADRPAPTYPWGDTAGHEHANYGRDKCCKGWTHGPDQWLNTSPVGKFPPNKFGLSDMVGNVWQWVEDPWHRHYNGAPTDGSVWAKGGDDGLRAIRGGSWIASPEFIRSAARKTNGTLIRDDGLGFRVARDLAH
jgi:formylglycine-generating enzyme required for sulfatase activity